MVQNQGRWGIVGWGGSRSGHRFSLFVPPRYSTPVQSPSTGVVRVAGGVEITLDRDRRPTDAFHIRKHSYLSALGARTSRYVKIWQRRRAAGRPHWLFTSPSTDARIKWGPVSSAKGTLGKKRNPLLCLTNVTELSVLLNEVCLSRNRASLIPGSWRGWKKQIGKSQRRNKSPKPVAFVVFPSKKERQN